MKRLALCALAALLGCEPHDDSYDAAADQDGASVEPPPAAPKSLGERTTFLWCEKVVVRCPDPDRTGHVEMDGKAPDGDETTESGPDVLHRFSWPEPGHYEARCRTPDPTDDDTEKRVEITILEAPGPGDLSLLPAQPKLPLGQTVQMDVAYQGTPLTLFRSAIVFTLEYRPKGGEWTPWQSFIEGGVQIQAMPNGPTEARIRAHTPLDPMCVDLVTDVTVLDLVPTPPQLDFLGCGDKHAFTKVELIDNLGNTTDRTATTALAQADGLVAGTGGLGFASVLPGDGYVQLVDNGTSCPQSVGKPINPRVSAAVHVEPKSFVVADGLEKVWTFQANTAFDYPLGLQDDCGLGAKTQRALPWKADLVKIEVDKSDSDGEGAVLAPGTLLAGTYASSWGGLTAALDPAKQVLWVGSKPGKVHFVATYLPHKTTTDLIVIVRPVTLETNIYRRKKPPEPKQTAMVMPSADLQHIADWVRFDVKVVLPTDGGQKDAVLLDPRSLRLGVRGKDPEDLKHGALFLSEGSGVMVDKPTGEPDLLREPLAASLEQLIPLVVRDNAFVLHGYAGADTLSEVPIVADPARSTVALPEGQDAPIGTLVPRRPVLQPCIGPLSDFDFCWDYVYKTQSAGVITYRLSLPEDMEGVEQEWDPGGNGPDPIEFDPSGVMGFEVEADFHGDTAFPLGGKPVEVHLRNQIWFVVDDVADGSHEATLKVQNRLRPEWDLGVEAPVELPVEHCTYCGKPSELALLLQYPDNHGEGKSLPVSIEWPRPTASCCYKPDPNDESGQKCLEPKKPCCSDNDPLPWDIAEIPAPGPVEAIDVQAEALSSGNFFSWTPGGSAPANYVGTLHLDDTVKDKDGHLCPPIGKTTMTAWYEPYNELKPYPEIAAGAPASQHLPFALLNGGNAIRVDRFAVGLATQAAADFYEKAQAGQVPGVKPAQVLDPKVVDLSVISISDDVGKFSEKLSDYTLYALLVWKPGMPLPDNLLEISEPTEKEMQAGRMKSVECDPFTQCKRLRARASLDGLDPTTDHFLVLRYKHDPGGGEAPTVHRAFLIAKAFSLSVADAPEAKPGAPVWIPLNAAWQGARDPAVRHLRISTAPGAAMVSMALRTNMELRVVSPYRMTTGILGLPEKVGGPALPFGLWPFARQVPVNGPVPGEDPPVRVELMLPTPSRDIYAFHETMDFELFGNTTDVFDRDLYGKPGEGSPYIQQSDGTFVADGMLAVGTPWKYAVPDGVPDLVSPTTSTLGQIVLGEVRYGQAEAQDDSPLDGLVVRPLDVLDVGTFAVYGRLAGAFKADDEAKRTPHVAPLDIKGLAEGGGTTTGAEANSAYVHWVEIDPSPEVDLHLAYDGRIGFMKRGQRPNEEQGGYVRAYNTPWFYPAVKDGDLWVKEEEKLLSKCRDEKKPFDRIDCPPTYDMPKGYPQLKPGWFGYELLGLICGDAKWYALNDEPCDVGNVLTNYGYTMAPGWTKAAGPWSQAYAADTGDTANVLRAVGGTSGGEFDMSPVDLRLKLSLATATPGVNFRSTEAAVGMLPPRVIRDSVKSDAVSNVGRFLDDLGDESLRNWGREELSPEGYYPWGVPGLRTAAWIDPKSKQAEIRWMTFPDDGGKPVVAGRLEGLELRGIAANFDHSLDWVEVSARKDENNVSFKKVGDLLITAFVKLVVQPLAKGKIWEIKKNLYSLAADVVEASAYIVPDVWGALLGWSEDEIRENRHMVVGLSKHIVTAVSLLTDVAKAQDYLVKRAQDLAEIRRLSGMARWAKEWQLGWSEVDWYNLRFGKQVRGAYAKKYAQGMGSEYGKEIDKLYQLKFAESAQAFITHDLFQVEVGSSYASISEEIAFLVPEAKASGPDDRDRYRRYSVVRTSTPVSVKLTNKNAFDIGMDRKDKEKNAGRLPNRKILWLEPFVSAFIETEPAGLSVPLGVPAAGEPSVRLDYKLMVTAGRNNVFSTAAGRARRDLLFYALPIGSTRFVPAGP